MTSPDLISTLVVTRNLPPLVGGMERLIWHIILALGKHQKVHVVGPSGCKNHLPIEVTADEVPFAPMPRFILGAALRSIFFAIRNRPTIVLAGSGLTAPLAWITARIVGASSVVYLHGLDIEVEHPVYRCLWRPFFRHFDLVLVNNRSTRNLAIKAGIASERIAILHPGVTLPDLSQARLRREEFRGRFGLEHRPLMLYVGRINARKGLAVFVRDILPLVIAAVPDAHLVVIGDEPKHALRHTPGEWAKVVETLDESGLGRVINFLGPQDDDTLSSAYMAADAMVFPVQEIPGDVEGFGMVAIEAAAHNLPTIAFAVGGVPDAIMDGISGSLIPAGKNDVFAQAVVRLLIDPSVIDFAPRDYAQSFCWDHFGERLRGLLPNG